MKRRMTMNRRVFVRSAAFLLGSAAAGSVLPALADKGRLVLIPATVASGNPGNGAVVTGAIHRSLERAGFTIVPAASVRDVLHAQRLEDQQILSDAQVARVRDALGADFVVYPRVLSVGLAVGKARQLQANVLVNVQGKKGVSYIHTRQVGQVFDAVGEPRPDAVIDPGAADTAAAKLLEGFYAKVSK